MIGVDPNFCFVNLSIKKIINQVVIRKGDIIYVESFERSDKKNYLCHRLNMVVVAQLVRALDCGSRGRRFEPGLPPKA